SVFHTDRSKISLLEFSRIVVYCSVLKVLLVLALQRQLLYITKAVITCQELFLLFAITFRYPSWVSSNILAFFVLSCQDIPQTFFTISSFALNIPNTLSCFLQTIHFPKNRTNGEGGI
ncbi:MAG: hypothetical protein KHY31_16600, partial [Clostridiales bacterium]|nr:hypothetical protein [Clostridiales bacterium]